MSLVNAGTVLLLLLLAACSPEADSPDEAVPAPSPRITAEHPVTARPALEAGLLDDGAAGGGPVLGEAGPVDGLDAGGASLTAVLPADDVAESIDFYVGLLGFDVTSSEPADPPFRRVELARSGVRLVLVGPEAWQREMPRFGETPAADVSEGNGSAGEDGSGGGESTEDEEGGDEDSGDEDSGEENAGEEGDTSPSGGVEVGTREGSGGAGPVLRLALGDLPAIAEGLTEAGLVVEVRDGPAGAPGRRLAVVDPAGNRLLLVPVAGP